MCEAAVAPSSLAYSTAARSITSFTSIYACVPLLSRWPGMAARQGGHQGAPRAMAGGALHPRRCVHEVRQLAEAVVLKSPALLGGEKRSVG